MILWNVWLVLWELACSTGVSVRPVLNSHTWWCPIGLNSDSILYTPHLHSEHSLSSQSMYSQPCGHSGWLGRKGIWQLIIGIIWLIWKEYYAGFCVTEGLFVVWLIWEESIRPVVFMATTSVWYKPFKSRGHCSCGESQLTNYRCLAFSVSPSYTHTLACNCSVTFERSFKSKT